jgi:hypothetical protein
MPWDRKQFFDVFSYMLIRFRAVQGAPEGTPDVDVLVRYLHCCVEVLHFSLVRAAIRTRNDMLTSFPMLQDRGIRI